MNKIKLIISHSVLFSGLLFSSINGNTQDMYASFNVGYNFPAGAQTLDINSTSTVNSTILEPVNISLGKGINISGAFGYSLSDNIAAELGVTYLISAKHEAIFNNANQPRTRTDEYAGSMFKVNPQVVFFIPMEGSVQPYAKIGVILGFGSVKLTITDNDIANSQLDIEEWKYSGGLGLGINSGFGAYYRLKDNIRLFGELNITSLTYTPTKGKLTTATSNGADQIPGLDTIDKEIIFVDKLDVSVNIPNSSPSEQLKVKLPYGSIGINVGISISF